MATAKHLLLQGRRAGITSCLHLRCLVVISTCLCTLSPRALIFAAEAIQTTPPEATTSQQQQESEENRKREAEETKRLTELYLRNQSVFLRKGELMVEVNTFYYRNSQQNLVPVNGGIAPVQTTRRFIDTNLIVRYGFLTDGLELDLIAPINVYAEQT